MYNLYILRSEVADKTYVGISDDPKRRLWEHNNGFSFYTKRYKPWNIVYTEQLSTREFARRREKYFKSAAGRRWMKKKLFH